MKVLPRTFDISAEVQEDPHLSEHTYLPIAAPFSLRNGHIEMRSHYWLSIAAKFRKEFANCLALSRQTIPSAAQLKTSFGQHYVSRVH